MDEPGFRYPMWVGRRVLLRPCLPTDYAYLYNLASQPENCIRWRNRGTTPSYESFVRLLWEDVPYCSL